MGFEGGGRRRRAIPVEVERGGLRFQLDAAAGTVTCPICRAFGSAAGPDMPVFMAKHVAEHVGTAATPAPTVDRGAVIAALAEQLAQLGDDELAVVDRVVTRLVSGRAQYGELNLNRDRRDFMSEASDELVDYLVYTAIGSVRRRGGS